MVQIPRVPAFCFVVPLRIGAFIIAAWMLFWNGWSGLGVMLTSYGSTTFSILWKLLGVSYLAVAAIALLGAYSIYNEIPHRVALFVRLYLGSIVFYFVAQILFIIIMEISVASVINQAKHNCEVAQQSVPANLRTNCNLYTNTGYPLVSWLIPFLFAVPIQAYFWICVRSYSLELNESTDKSAESNSQRVV